MQTFNNNSNNNNNNNNNNNTVRTAYIRPSVADGLLSVDQ